uniref:Uncharacterized protein n=2 Tax=Arabidopsis thaliana TaxID=3702 RepID=Q1G3D6_ARATH|nr:unknown protein [Arabidopsis thaliana]
MREERSIKIIILASDTCWRRVPYLSTRQESSAAVFTLLNTAVSDQPPPISAMGRLFLPADLHSNQKKHRNHLPD